MVKEEVLIYEIVDDTHTHMDAGWRVITKAHYEQFVLSWAKMANACTIQIDSKLFDNIPQNSSSKYHCDTTNNTYFYITGKSKSMATTTTK